MAVSKPQCEKAIPTALRILEDVYLFIA